MPVLQHIPIFVIKLGEPDAPLAAMTPVPVRLMDDIAEIVVDMSLHLPDMVTIQLYDPALEWANDAELFALGKKVAIQVQPAQAAKGELTTLIEAEITALEPLFLGQGTSMLLVRGYARSHRLHFGKHSRTFTNQKDSDIVKKIAQEVGLTPSIDDTGVTHEYVLQNNQTNMEFLVTRAQRIGYQVFVFAGELYFKKGDSALEAPAPKLDLGVELQTFRPRVTLAHQAEKVRVHGWDAKSKQQIIGRATAGDGLTQAEVNKNGGGQKVKQAFRLETNAVIVDQPVASTAEANALAQGLANDLRNEYIEAEGACQGNPAIRAGGKVELTGLGARYNGHYFVTAATHLYSAGGYSVEFKVQGRQPHTLHYLLSNGAVNQGGAAGKVNGMVIGLVTNLNDPEKFGRIKVKFPWLVDDNGKEIESAWAKLCSPMAGQDKKGFYYLPEIDDEVLVAFEHGDVNHPYIVGVLWNNKDQPPKPNSEVLKNGKVVKRILRSRSGHEIVFDDSDDKPSIAVHTKGGHTFDLDDAPASSSVAVRTKAGHKVVLDDAPGRESILLVDRTGANQIKIDAVANQVSIKAVGILRLEAAQIILSAQAGLALSAPGGSTIESDGPISIRSSAVVAVQGAVIKLN